MTGLIFEKLKSFLTFDPIDRTLKCYHLLQSDLTQFVILENFSILDLELSGQKKNDTR